MDKARFAVVANMLTSFHSLNVYLVMIEQHESHVSIHSNDINEITIMLFS